MLKKFPLIALGGLLVLFPENTYAGFDNMWNNMKNEIGNTLTDEANQAVKDGINNMKESSKAEQPAQQPAQTQTNTQAKPATQAEPQTIEPAAGAEPAGEFKVTPSSYKEACLKQTVTDKSHRSHGRNYANDAYCSCSTDIFFGSHAGKYELQENDFLGTVIVLPNEVIGEIHKTCKDKV